MRNKYQVKPGCKHGAGQKYGPGDIVELTPNEAAGFLDKLTLVGEAAQPDVAPVEVHDEVPVAYFEVEVDASTEVEAPVQVKDLMKGTAINALVNAGYDTAEKVEAATDTELVVITGVGQSTVDKLRSRIADIED